MSKLKFLEGGGEMGALIRSYDWEKTPLGKPENWSHSLQTTVGIILHSAFPMFLFWGKDLICFYNDAYRPSLGNNGKHPLIAKKGKESWPEIWDFIGPLIEKVMTTGEAVWFEDQFLPIYRNGKMEDVYWTFSYSPAYGDNNSIEGVFVTCTETTSKVLAHKEIQESELKFRALVEEAPVGTCLFTGREMKVEIINDIMVGYWGKGHTVLGKSLIDALPELKNQPFLKLLDDVYTTGKSYTAKGALVELEVDGIKSDYYYDFTYKPVYKSSGEIFGIINVSIDATERVLAQQQLENSQKELLSYFEQSPVAIATISKENLTFRLVNPFYAELVGRTQEELENKPLLEALPELSGQGFDDLLRGVIESGNAYIANEIPAHLKRNGKLETVFVNLTYAPQRDSKGEVIGVLVVATDVSEQVLARQKIEESEAHLQLTRDAVPAMIFYLDSEQRYRSYNRVFMKWFNVNETEALGKTVKEFVGETTYAKVGPNLAKAYAGERVEYHMYAPRKIEGERWLNIAYTPNKKPDGTVTGVIVHATDITEHILALRKIEESETRFRNLLQEAPVAATLFQGPELVIEIANELTLKYWGKNKDIIGKPLAVAAPELEDQQLINVVRDVYNRGGLASFSETPIRFIEDGVWKERFYSFSLKALYNSNGEVESVLSTGIDVTEQVTVLKQIEQSEKELRDLISAAPIGICVLSGIEARIEEVNERFIIISGKKPEQYVDATYWEVFPEVAEPFAAVLENVFKTGIKFTTEEAELVLIRHGVPETMFATFEYIPVFEVGSNAVTKIIVMVVEVTHQVETRKEIEKAVVERTKQLGESNLRLKRSNEELEQFAYIASHDLQEPVRKISTFTQLLEFSINDISPKSQGYISKIYNSTDRMTKLIRDVLAFSRIREEANNFERVDLNNIVEQLKNDFELQVEETGATVETANLPVVEAIQPQMIQLFSNLMSNALKYRKQGVKPVIKISADVSESDTLTKQFMLDKNKKYYHIEFSDNGIGFKEDYVERIFKIFQRLHGKTEYEGTGIGLAICRRIVQNHQGHISAAVGENGGAVFHILLPVTQPNATLIVDNKDAMQ